MLLVTLVFSCQKTVNEEIATDVNISSKRMAFNQDVYLLNSTTTSTIYKVNYDFQGLQGDAFLEELPISTTIPKGGHMCISPDQKFLTVVISRGKNQGTIYLIDLFTYAVKTIRLFNYDASLSENDIIEAELANNQQYQFNGKITQVDVDEAGYLFIAGKSGFYKVVADWSTTANPADGGHDIWSNTWDTSYNDFDVDSPNFGETWAYVVPFTFAEGNVIESTDELDEEIYFEDLTPFDETKVKFLGGDILFTQNNFETDGFEQQRLLSFSQWKNNVAIALDLNWDWENQNISFKANKVFSFHKNMYGKVTGAALTGDNMLFTSHHKKTNINLWTLSGELLAQPELFLPDGSKLEHNWGDMASKQLFDKNTLNPRSISDEENIQNKELHGEYYEHWYRGDLPYFQYAEIKLYRPDLSFNYEVGDLSHDNYNISRESRRNSANADLADYRKNASKFVSLGGNNGYVIMKLPTPHIITNHTTLQVVETSWNRPSDFYDDNDNVIADDAWSSYKEKAEVFVHTTYNGRYLQNELIDAIGDESVWKPIGQAYVANNEFNIGDDFEEGTEVSWILIKDNGSQTGDAFDVNFVSMYNKEPEPSAINDRRVLELFYDALDGDNWVNNTNWKSDKPLSEWYGITTDANERVVGINLYENGLKGPIISDFSQLSELTYFSINNQEHYPGQYVRRSYNRITGTFPHTFFDLTNLKVIELSYNYGFNGELSGDIGKLSNLEKLWISGNHFKGKLPRELGTLQKLTFLSFIMNEFDGPLISEIATLPLVYFRCHYNYFTSIEEMVYNPSFHYHQKYNLAKALDTNPYYDLSN